jgi:hypothetical protein
MPYGSDLNPSWGLCFFEEPMVHIQDNSTGVNGADDTLEGVETAVF